MATRSQKADEIQGLEVIAVEMDPPTHFTSPALVSKSPNVSDSLVSNCHVSAQTQ